MKPYLWKYAGYRLNGVIGSSTLASPMAGMGINPSEDKPEDAFAQRPLPTNAKVTPEADESKTPQANLAQGEEGEGTKAPRVLILDDEANVRRVCYFALRVEGWHAESEGSAQLALSRFAAGERFDAVVLDYAMPEMDGLEWLERLTALQLTFMPRILMASAHADGAVAFRAMAHGVWDFVSKPLTPDDIRRRIHRMLNRQALADGGDVFAQALMAAHRRDWEGALRALEGVNQPLGYFLAGLVHQQKGDLFMASHCFDRGQWWMGWEKFGPEIWRDVSRRLDL